MADVQAVGKTGYNEQQGFSFRGVDAVVDAVGPALRTHGVLVTPRVLWKSHRDFETKNKALMHECIVEVEYTFTGPEGDTHVGSSIGESADSGDKGTAKAMSVAYRTWWLQALCIPTHEPDPDGETYERATATPPVEIIPAAEAKTRLLAASDEDTAVLMWADRKSESIPLPELEGLIRTAQSLMPAGSTEEP